MIVYDQDVMRRSQHETVCKDGLYHLSFKWRHFLLNTIINKRSFNGSTEHTHTHTLRNVSCMRKLILNEKVYYTLVMHIAIEDLLVI